MGAAGFAADDRGVVAFGPLFSSAGFSGALSAPSRPASSWPIALESGALQRGDLLHFRGHTTDFYQSARRLEREHREIELARAGETVGVQVDQRVREGDRVFKLVS